MAIYSIFVQNLHSASKEKRRKIVFALCKNFIVYPSKRPLYCAKSAQDIRLHCANFA